MSVEIKWRKFHALALPPAYAYPTDSGADLRFCEDVAGVTLYSGETRKFHLGVGVRLPAGYELQMRPRSSMSARGILCHWGTVDEAFTGQLATVLTNLSREPVVIQRGDKICQVVLVPRVVGVQFTQVDDLGETDRGQLGWGSSGT